MLMVILMVCCRGLITSKWRSFPVLSDGSSLDVLTVCPNNDCFVEVKWRSKLLFEDNKSRFPWFGFGIKSSKAYGLVVCDKTSASLILLMDTKTNAELSLADSNAVLRKLLAKFHFVNDPGGLGRSSPFCSELSSESESLRKAITDAGGESAVITLDD